MDIRRVLTLARRVFIQIIHDRRTLALIFIVPIVTLALSGVLFKSNPVDIPLGVENIDKGAEAPAPLGRISLAALIIDELEKSGTFSVRPISDDDATASLASGSVKAVLIFAQDFTEALLGSGQTTVQLYLEGTNPATAATISNNVTRIIMQRLAEMSNVLMDSELLDSQSGAASQPPAGVPIRIETRFLYGGPQFNSLDYVAPVFIAFFVFFFVFLLTCVFFLRERSQGTLERLMATPVNRLEIIIGYVLGLGVFALLQSAVVLLFTVFALQIHYKGSLALVFLIEVVLMLVAANLGILASAYAANEFQAVQFIPIVIVPQALLSGAFWAVEQMPSWLQPLSRVMPMTYANQALRDVMIKGQGIGDIWQEILILSGFAALAVILATLAVRREVV
jgi:ABC-2 type transport system permease protein